MGIVIHNGCHCVDYAVFPHVDSPTMTAPSVINLSHRYIYEHTIRDLIQQYTPIYAQHATSSSSSASLLPTHLSFESSIFPDVPSTLSALQSFLALLSPSLISLNLAQTNLSGRLFFRGRTVELPAEEAEEARVFIEGRETTGGRIIVRDDEPPALRDAGQGGGAGVSYRYVSTTYDEDRAVFVRTYAEMGWLQLREVNMSSTDLSSHGLQSLLCCTGWTLTVLRLNDCPHVDNSGVFTLTALCRHLHTLELSHCPLLTEHALMALADLPHSSVSALAHLYVCHPTIPNLFFTALLNALQDRGFRGVFVYDAAHPRYTQAVRTPILPLLRPGTVQDLTYADATHAVLKIITEEQLQRLRDTKAALVQRWSSEQQRQYQYMLAMAGGAAPQGTVYSLDLSQHSYVNDALLRHILEQFGAQLFVLKLSHTFVTAHGLGCLSLCPHLRVLSLSSCHSLHDKQAANATMIDVIRGMPELMELNISDSRLSGRMLAKHPMLALFTFYAHACPISTRAVRLLSETCADSLSVLSLSRCPFVNVQSMYYVMRMHRLVVLDVSFCQALSTEAVEALEAFEGLDIRRINVSGVHGVTREVCRAIADGINRRKRESGMFAADVEVVWQEEGSMTPTGAGSLSSPTQLSSPHDFNYSVVGPANPTTQQPMREEEVAVRSALGERETQENEESKTGAAAWRASPRAPLPLYSVMPNTVEDCDDEAHPEPGVVPPQSHHHHSASASYAVSSRPANPTPSASTAASGRPQWPSLPSKMQHAKTLPRQLPSSTVHSAASSSAASPLVMASTPSAASSLSSGLHRPHLLPHVSLPASPVVSALSSPVPPLAGAQSASMSPPPLGYSPVSDN